MGEETVVFFVFIERPQTIWGLLFLWRKQKNIGTRKNLDHPDGVGILM